MRGYGEVGTQAWSADFVCEIEVATRFNQKYPLYKPCDLDGTIRSLPVMIGSRKGTEAGALAYEIYRVAHKLFDQFFSVHLLSYRIIS